MYVEHLDLQLWSHYQKLIHSHSDIRLIRDGCEIDFGLVYGTGSRGVECPSGNEINAAICMQHHPIRFAAEFILRVIRNYT